MILFKQKRSWVILVSFLVLFGGLALRIFREYHIVNRSSLESWTKDQKADCAVVLTGGAHRVREGIDLLVQKNILKLIISGVHSGAQLKDLLPLKMVYGALNEQDVFLERQSQTTFGNAVQSLPLVEVLRCRNVLLVTSQLHMYRAQRTFHSIYPKEIQIIPHAVHSGTEPLNFWDIFSEAVKSFFYSAWAYGEGFELQPETPPRVD